MRIKFFISLMLLALQAVAQPVQHLPEKPRMVVVIKVDGLQPLHLDQLWTRLGPGGFRKLAGQGASFQRMQSNVHSLGNAADIATVMTGTVPYYHGVVGNRVYQRHQQTTQSVFEDKNHSGIDSHLRLSALKLRATTFTDELMIQNAGQSKSFAVAIHPEDAIAMGGHAANGVVWMDDVFLRWSSTTYYTGGMPLQAMQMNAGGDFRRIAERVWQPMFAPRTYLAAMNERNVKSFEFKPAEQRIGKSSNTILKSTPSANALVADLGLRIFQEESMGMNNHSDVLMLQFTVRTPNEQQFSLQNIVKEDIYLRLDAELQYLIQKIESRVGAERVLFVLFGNQTNTTSPTELKEHHIHAGYFNANRAMALLNSYLMVTYGQEKWIEGYYGKHIYLNKTKIAEKQIPLRDFQETVKEFMMEFEGVQSAFSMQDVMRAAVPYTTELGRLRNSVHKSTAGDVLLTLMPGWLEMDELELPVGESGSLNAYLPFYLYGWKIVPQRVGQRVQMTDVAPTLSQWLRIPDPNANLGEIMPVQLRTTDNQ